MMKHRLAIILVNYKQAGLTAECVASICLSSFDDYQIIIVDNGSLSSSYNALKNSCPDATIIPSEKNLGYGGGNNAGIRCAMESEAELVLLLNNDTIIDKDLLKTIVETADSIPQAGVIGASIYYYDNPKMIWYPGGTG